MRVVMFGFQTWGRKTLRALIDLDHEVVLAVTHRAGEHSYRAIFSDSVEELARAHGIPVHLTERVDAATIDLVKRAAPDVSSSTAGTPGCPPGRVIVQEGGGAVVSGPQAFRGGNRALVVTLVRTPDGVEHRGDEFFLRGGYLNDRI